MVAVVLLGKHGTGPQKARRGATRLTVLGIPAMEPMNLAELRTVALPTEVRHLGCDFEGHDYYLVPGDRVIVVEHFVAGN